MASAAIFIIGQVTRDYGGEPSLWWDRSDETQLRCSMPVLTDQINRSWIWSYLKVGFVVSVRVKNGMRSDALHQAFLSFAALSRMFRQSQLQILLG